MTLVVTDAAIDAALKEWGYDAGEGGANIEPMRRALESAAKYMSSSVAPSSTIDLEKQRAEAAVAEMRERCVKVVERLRSRWNKRANNNRYEHNRNDARLRVLALDEALLVLRTLPSAPEPAQQPVAKPKQKVSGEELRRLIDYWHDIGGHLSPIVRTIEVLEDLRDLRRAWPGTLDRAIEVVEQMRDEWARDPCDFVREGVDWANAIIAALRAANTGSTER